MKIDDLTAKNEDKQLGGSISASNITGAGIIVGRNIKVGNIITRPEGMKDIFVSKTGSGRDLNCLQCESLVWMGRKGWRSDQNVIHFY